MNPGMRQQMQQPQQQHMQPQHQQQQFMVQSRLPQYGGMQGPGPAPNVTMGQMAPHPQQGMQGGGYGQPQQMQGMAHPGPRMGQQQQMQQQQMQLQRQLSGGKPQQHNPYQGQF